jgi:hypothetical protein
MVGMSALAGEPAAPVAALPARRLPFGVLVVVVLRLMNAVVIAAIGLGWRPLKVDFPYPLDEPAVLAGLGLSWAFLIVLGVAGLLLLRRWGWVITMFMVGIGLAVNLGRIIAGVPDELDLALLVATAFYLNGRSVRALALRPRPVRRP